jgi:hypothetical protein
VSWWGSYRTASIVEGFLKGADFLLPAEKDELLSGAQLMTYEVGLRFLTDYLSGDRYFKTASGDHNLVRCRTQMALTKAMEDRSEKLQKIVELSWNRIQEGMAEGD